MTLRHYLHDLEAQGRMVKVTPPVSKDYEAAGILKKLEPSPVLFSQIKEDRFRVAGNLVCTKAAFAEYLGIQVKEIIPTLIKAIDQPSPCEIVQAAPCQESSQ